MTLILKGRSAFLVEINFNLALHLYRKVTRIKPQEEWKSMKRALCLTVIDVSSLSLLDGASLIASSFLRQILD